MRIIVTDPQVLIYDVGIPIDPHFGGFRNGLLMNPGDEFVFGPQAGQITLTSPPDVGDELEFRRI